MGYIYKPINEKRVLYAGHPRHNWWYIFLNYELIGHM